MVSQAQSRATAKYNRTHYKQYAIRYSLKDDADVIKALDEAENKADYIRRLIRADIKQRV